MNRWSVSAGFTLLEMLVATAVFSVLSVIAYGGLQTVLEAREETAAHSARLARVQLMLGLMQQDFVQVVERKIRDENGMTRPAFVGESSLNSIEFTKGGLANPLAQERSRLQRISYGIKDGALHRLGWRVLDRAQDSAPDETLTLSGVNSWQLRYLDRNNEWQESWAEQLSGHPMIPTSTFPRAVEVTLELDEWGTLRRVYKLPYSLM